MDRGCYGKCFKLMDMDNIESPNYVERLVSRKTKLNWEELHFDEPGLLSRSLEKSKLLNSTYACLRVYDGLKHLFRIKCYFLAMSSKLICTVLLYKICDIIVA